MKRLRWIIPLYLGLIVFCIVALSFLMTPLKEAPYQGDNSNMKWFLRCSILILVILIGIAIFTFSKNEKITLAPYQRETSEIEVSIEPDKLIYNRHDIMTLTIYNQTTADILTGHALSFEIKIDDQWYTIETGYFYHLNYVGLLAGKSVTEKIDLSTLEYTFRRGNDYRVTKMIDGKYVVSSIFRIE